LKSFAIRACPALVALATVACGAPSSNSTDGAVAGGDAHDDALRGDGSTSGGRVAILVEPNGNNASELIAAVNGATSSVYMTMYQIDRSDLLAALVARKSAGLDVQVILDGSTTNKAGNTAAYNQLSAAGVSVVWSNPAFNFTHEKCVVIDGAYAWIMTMNANISSARSNREYLAIDTDPGDVAEATAVFHADHASQSIVPTGNLVVANANARPKLVQLIGTATVALDLEGEEFSDTYSTGVANAVAQAAQRGVAVRVVIAKDNSPLPSQTQAIATVKQAGAKVVVSGPTSGSGSSTNPYIHAKAIVVDCNSAGSCARGFVGSENFSGGSLGYNRELGVIFDDPVELAKVEAAIASDFARGVPQ